MNPNRIRVLSFIESVTVTGPSRVLIDFAEQARHPEPGLPAVDVTLATYQRGGGDSNLAKAARAAGVPVIDIPERNRWDASVIAGVRRIVSEVKPDILESRNVKSHFLIRLTGLHRQVPWVAWNHGYTSKDRLDRAYTQLDRWSLHGAFRVMTVCQSFAAAIEKLGIARDRITVLHNFAKPYAPPDAEQVTRLKQQLGLGDELIVLTVGRMSREKGHTDLLSAIASLKDMPGLPRHRFVLVGDGPEEANLRSQAATVGIDDRIVWTGFQGKVAPYYAIANIFALPSHSEGSPNVVLEAMSAGLPMAATRAGGVPEILDDDVTGLLVPIRNPQALAEALRKLLLSEDLRTRLASAARRQVESAHTLQAYRRDLTEFYLETLRMREGKTERSMTSKA